MYTTLNFLKANKACVPGYTRMISFFGNSPSIKDVHIPLYMVAIAGLAEDLGWAISNAMIIDAEDYRVFRRRHLLALLRRVFSYSNSRLSIEEHTPLFEARAKLEFIALRTYEEAEAWLTKWSAYSSGSDFFRNVIQERAFYSPKAFIEEVFDNYRNTVALRAKSLLTQGYKLEKDYRARLIKEYGPLPKIRDLDLEVDTSWFAPKEKNSNRMLLSIFGPADKDTATAAMEFMYFENMIPQKAKQGLTLERAMDAPKFNMKVDLSDPELMLKIYRLISARGEDSMLQDDLETLGEAPTQRSIRLEDEDVVENENEADERSEEF